MRTSLLTSTLLAASLFAATGCDDDEGGAARDAADAGRRDGGQDAAIDAEGAEDDAGGSADLDADDGLQEVSIRFKAKIGDRDLACGEHYPDQGSSHVSATPRDFRFYVQEVRLVRADGSEEKVAFDDKPPFQSKDVALLDFTDGEGDCGSGGSVVNTTITGRVPAGAYEGIVFVNGVPEELNHAGPAETAAAPLDDATLFWGWLSGYRFIVAELLPTSAGHADGGADAGHEDAGGSLADAGAADGGTHGDGGTGDAGIHGDGGAGDAGTHGGGHQSSGAAAVHVGSTGCTGTQAAGYTCMRQARNEIRLEGFDPATSVVVADLAEVFENSDLQAPPQCHGVAPAYSAPYAALGVNMETGEPSDTQQVFRVE